MLCSFFVVCCFIFLGKLNSSSFGNQNFMSKVLKLARATSGQYTSRTKSDLETNWMSNCQRCSFKYLFCETPIRSRVLKIISSTNDMPQLAMVRESNESELEQYNRFAEYVRLISIQRIETFEQDCAHHLKMQPLRSLNELLTVATASFNSTIANAVPTGYKAAWDLRVRLFELQLLCGE
jgi:hypothetical protein